MKERAIESALRESRAVIEAACTYARVHSAGDVAAPYVASAKAAAVSTAEAGVTAAEAASVTATGVTSAVLRPEGNGEEKRERRDGCEATHTPLL